MITSKEAAHRFDVCRRIERDAGAPTFSAIKIVTQSEIDAEVAKELFLAQPRRYSGMTMDPGSEED